MHDRSPHDQNHSKWNGDHHSLPTFSFQALRSAVLTICILFSFNSYATDENEIPRGGRIVDGRGSIFQDGLFTTIN